jgi:Catalase (peroxidase I)
MELLQTIAAEGLLIKNGGLNQLNLSILHQHDKKSDPMDDGFDYAENFKSSIMKL